jgi:C-terminal processing protease CtpA/Prc
MNPPRPFPALAGAVALLFLLPRGDAADPVPSTTLEPYELPKVEVKSAAICSFGIGVIADWNRNTQTVTHLYVESITPGSAAETLGLARGDEILSINGRKITAMKGGFKHGSDLFNLLVDQPPGREVKLEVAVRTVKRVTLSALASY